jgi:hypothetical protein
MSNNNSSRAVVFRPSQLRRIVLVDGSGMTDIGKAGALLGAFKNLIYVLFTYLLFPLINDREIPEKSTTIYKTNGSFLYDSLLHVIFDILGRSNVVVDNMYKVHLVQNFNMSTAPLVRLYIALQKKGLLGPAGSNAYTEFLSKSKHLASIFHLIIIRVNSILEHYARPSQGIYKIGSTLWMRDERYLENVKLILEDLVTLCLCRYENYPPQLLITQFYLVVNNPDPMGSALVPVQNVRIGARNNDDTSKLISGMGKLKIHNW